MSEVRKNDDGTYITSCEDFIDYSGIAGKLSTLKDTVDGWIENYGQDAVISISYSEDTYEFEGMTVKYWRPSKKSEINRYERTERLEKLEEEKKLKRLSKKKSG
jgi:hypothetical protein